MLVLFLVYLLHILAVSLDKNIVYKYQLRGMIEKERNYEIQKIINTEYEKVYYMILEQIKSEKNHIQFNLLCFDLKDCDSKIFNTMCDQPVEGDKMMRIIQMYKIPIDSMIPKIIDKLKISFPNTNIIWKINKNNDENNNCINYILFW